MILRSFKEVVLMHIGMYRFKRVNLSFTYHLVWKAA